MRPQAAHVVPAGCGVEAGTHREPLLQPGDRPCGVQGPPGLAWGCRPEAEPQSLVLILPGLALPSDISAAKGVFFTVAEAGLDLTL